MRTLFLLPLAALMAAASTLTPVTLRCEYQQEPPAVHATQPRLGWQIKGAGRDLKQTAYRILVAASPEELARNGGSLWDTGKVSSSAQAHIAYAGKPLESGASYFWKVQVWDGAGAASAWSEPAQWTMGLLRAADWHARWIALNEQPTERMPVFRRSFELSKPVRSAVLYISGLGQYEATLNGAAVGLNVMQPAWTNYRKTVPYNTINVTRLLRPGANSIGVMLGNGMYHVVRIPGRFSKFVGSFGSPRLLAQLRITFADGTSTEVVTDKAWQMRPGPIVFSSIYGGEDYDARLEEGEWTEAREVAAPGGVMMAESSPPIRIAETLRPVRVTEPKPGVKVYDLGKNFSGWPRISVKGPAGAVVKIRPGELLDADGLVTQASQGGIPRRGFVWMTYTLNGSGVEVWRPRFFYYGFRYVQVEGAEVQNLTGEFIHSIAPVVGEFSCSKPLFNRIHDLIDTAILSNMQSVLTDCPHREKLGWLEQTHLAGPSILYNYDAARLYEKIQRDMRDAQTADGLVPNIAPEYVTFEDGYRDSPEWGAAAVMNPWVLYRLYGDRRLLAESYDMMAAYVRYLDAKAKDGILSHGLGDWYDVGPKPLGVSQHTSLGLTATATFYADLIAMRDAAALLGKTEDEKSWAATADRVRAAFNAKLFDPQTGIYDRGSQTACAMPLALGLVPEDRRAQVLDKLVESIRETGNRVTAGDVGFHYVVQALFEGGRSDVLYDMLSLEDGASYGGQLARGATALTEAWDASPTKSQNHFMLGHAEEWFYRGLAGLDIDFSRTDPAERIRIAPKVVGDITSARASYRSVYGEIAVEWKKEGERLRVSVDIPPNTAATVHLKDKSRRIGSGHYEFE